MAKYKPEQATNDAGQFPLPYPWVSMLASIMADNILLTVIINLGVTALVGFATFGQLRPEQRVTMQEDGG